MAQLVSPGGPRPSGSVTVADLVSRNAPVPDEILGSEPTRAVSVGSLLRREGRAAEAEPDGNDGARGTVRGAVVRGATIVAGTALVVGSAFGGAVLVETFLLDPEPTAGAAPASSAPDEAPAATPGAVVDQAAAGPDAGSGAPTAWTEVAFPTAATAVGGGTQSRDAAAHVTASPARSTPAPSAADEKQPDQEKSATKESAEKEATAPPAGASTADSTSDEPASSSGGTAEKNGGLVGTIVDTGKGLLGLG